MKRRNTKRQAENKLKQKGFSKEAVEYAIEKMEKYGYINDADYASAFVSDSVYINKYGKKKIRQMLYSKGVSKEIIETALEEILPEQEMENLRYFLIKTCPKAESITPEMAGKFQRKMMSRGYSYGQIEDILQEVVIEEDSF